jgi:hypothetical protein
MCKCPSCGSGYRKRVRRKFLLKLIPKAKAYKCYKCRTKYLFVPYFVPPVILLKGKKKVKDIAFTSRELIID